MNILDYLLDVDIPQKIGRDFYSLTHNGYLSILIQYGIIFGGLVIFDSFYKKFGTF